MKITTLCAIKSIQYLSERFDFEIEELIDFLKSEIFPFISVRNLQFNPKILTKLERVLIISMTEIENPN